MHRARSTKRQALRRCYGAAVLSACLAATATADAASSVQARAISAAETDAVLQAFGLRKDSHSTLVGSVNVFDGRIDGGHLSMFAAPRLADKWFCECAELFIRFDGAPGSQTARA